LNPRSLWPQGTANATKQVLNLQSHHRRSNEAASPAIRFYSPQRAVCATLRATEMEDMKERTSDDEERSKPSHGRQGTREPSQATRLALGLARRGASVSGARLRRTARVRGSGAWLGRAARVHSSGAAQAHCSGARLGRSARVHGSGAWLRRRARAALSRGSVAGFGRSIHIDTDAHTHTHMTHTRTCTHAHMHTHTFTDTLAHRHRHAHSFWASGTPSWGHFGLPLAVC